MKKRILILGVTITMLLSAGCGEAEPVQQYGGTQQSADAPKQETEGSENTDAPGEGRDFDRDAGTEQGEGTAAPESNDMLLTASLPAADAADYRQLSAGVNGLTFQMFDRLRGGDNFVFSGYSMASAFGLLDLAAVGESAKELEALLGITDYVAWHGAMGAYLRKAWADTTYLLTANKVWLSDRYELSPDVETAFNSPAKSYYLSELETLSFQKEKSIKKMNKWVAEQTKNMIPKLVDKIEPDTAVILTNAVYFNGKWAEQFDPKRTRQEIFHGRRGDTQADMMFLNGERFRYLETETLQGISMPYKDSTVSMKLFIAKDSAQADGKTAGDIFADMTAEQKEELLVRLDEVSPSEIKMLQLPKWETETSVDGLGDILKNLGLERCFDKEYAEETAGDFTRIGEHLVVSAVLHKAKIIVAEDGTEAAAVTAIMMDSCSSMMEQEPVYFIADRPFVYVIQDVETGIILFMGEVNDL